jgi:hypothetical protein
MTIDHTKAEPLKSRELRGRNLDKYELETVINFNKSNEDAVIFTYEGAWQRHIEKKMGIKPYLDNGFGGKGYKVPKKQIRKPSVKRFFSDEQRQIAKERFAQTRALGKLRNTGI